MLLTIHNLPAGMRYADVKSLIVAKCGIKDVILDNLVPDGLNTKKVTVGLAEEEDAAMLVRKINGLFLEGKQLFVEDVRKKKKAPEQQIYQNYKYESPNTDTQTNNQQPNYPAHMNFQQGHYPNQMPGDQQLLVNLEQPIMPMLMPSMGGMYYTPQGQNSYMDYTGQTQQFSPSATQYPQVSGQQGQSGSGSDHQTPTEDNWSRERRFQSSASHESNYNSLGNQSTYKSDTRQRSHRWAEGSNDDTQRRRSRSPRNKRERSRGGSSLSPKRARNENYNRDSYKKSFNSNRDPLQYPADTDDTYGDPTYEPPNYGISRQNKPYTSTSQTYGNSNQNKPYYNNDPITATSSNSQLLSNRPAQNQGNVGASNPAFEPQMRGRFSDSNTCADKPQVAIWDRKVAASPSDSRSNYRKHSMAKKDVQDQSKNTWRNPAQTSWDSQGSTSYGDESISPYSWRNPGPSQNDPKASWGDQKRASDKDELQLGKNQQKSFERSSFDKPQPVKSAPKGESNLQKKWPNKPKKNKGKGKAKNTMMPLIQQDSTYRFKAACRIAGEIAKAHPNIIKEEYFNYLRQSVRSRLEILLAENLGESIEQMVAIYRAKFPPFQDREFCKLVVQQIPPELKKKVELKDSGVKAEAVKQGKATPQVSKNQPAGQKSQPLSGKGQTIAGSNQPVAGSNQPVAGKSQPKAGKRKSKAAKSQLGNSQPVLPRLQLLNPGDKLPQYPNANKQVYKEQKKLKKLEHQTEDIYTLPPLIHQALEEELTIISDIFKTVVSNADSEQEKGLCDRFLSVGLDHVRKVVKLNVAKRILNINTNLIIRVLVSGKPPKKKEVEFFLRREKVVSMKKSGKKNIVYVVTCSDYETYDRLLQMQCAHLNSETLLRFKPFQLAGPKLSYKERNELRIQRVRGLDEIKPQDFTEDNLGNDVWLDNEQIVEIDQACDQENGQDDQHGNNEANNQEEGQDDQHGNNEANNQEDGQDDQHGNNEANNQEDRQDDRHGNYEANDQEEGQDDQHGNYEANDQEEGQDDQHGHNEANNQEDRQDDRHGNNEANNQEEGQDDQHGNNEANNQEEGQDDQHGNYEANDQEEGQDDQHGHNEANNQEDRQNDQHGNNEANDQEEGQDDQHGHNEANNQEDRQDDRHGNNEANDQEEGQDDQHGNNEANNQEEGQDDQHGNYEANDQEDGQDDQHDNYEENNQGDGQNDQHDEFEANDQEDRQDDKHDDHEGAFEDIEFNAADLEDY